ncbi:hypothetical protein Tco_1194163 [Tanacetum coccineum]
MGDEHLDTIPSIENLVPIPSEFKGISEDMCDVPVCEDPSNFDALNDHSEILSDSNNDDTSSDDDFYENIEYIEVSPLNLEIVSLEEVNKDQKEKEFDLEDIFQIKTSGSTTTHANNSLPEFKSFHFDLYDDPSFPRPPPEPPDVENCLNFEPDTAVINNFDEDEYFDPGGVRILQKSQENGQSRTSTDTRRKRMYKSRGFNSKKGQKSTPVNPWSTKVNTQNDKTSKIPQKPLMLNHIT